MFKTIADQADCEVCSVIRFLSAKNVKPAEIHRQLVEIYGENVVLMKWLGIGFDNSMMNAPMFMTKHGVGDLLVNDGLVAKVNEKIRENSRFTIKMLCDEFPHISKIVLHEIVTNRLNYRKLCSRWVPKMLTDDHTTKGFGSALTFLTRYSEEGNEFLNKIVTGDETWVCHVTPESKQ
ncbi:hypothetical protein AVEN_163219-1 [Araneus ventricosus]|uniref:Mos1 transposase HTH domain-containing protein n=1 Tax=Araneus ventricosus TaxID=182803 RepID=A0A4Y2NZT4_ARAVE|nr:hypothetical protein AVEN_100524-1 [Araneus ventricosus]GBN44591.1 hypothetical protein AVEN_89295-1 [Araneus ventricosus]GBN44596.1 hypothetical protein AVEN_93615-1 [Araneus ventricosus]GBN44610.1 hypothetical protein AVEN_163219-1 [Araneus ventricosus]